MSITINWIFKVYKKVSNKVLKKVIFSGTAKEVRIMNTAVSLIDAGLCNIFSDKDELRKFLGPLLKEIQPTPLPTKKIKWLGTQKEFAEFILELQNKNWIAFEDCTSVAAETKELAKHFDLSGKENSLYQILKPQQNKGTDYEKAYPQVYTKRYQKKFDAIKKRKK